MSDDHNSRVTFKPGLQKINIQVISTSEIKISVLIKRKNVKKAIKCLHQEFKLNAWYLKLDHLEI